MKALSSDISTSEGFDFFGPSRFARFWAGGPAGPAYGGGGAEQGGWSGDHTFSSSAAVYGFWNYIEPEVSAEHPDWTPTHIYQESLLRFNLRLSENIRIGQKEERGEDNITTWRAEEHDGEVVLVIHGGAYDGYTLDRLWRQTEDYAHEVGMASVINQEEYRAQKALHGAIISGQATSTASIIGHPESVKIFQSMTRGDDGFFYSHQIDLEKAAGRTLTFVEGKILLAKLHEKHMADALISGAKHDHFMLKKSEIELQEVKKIARDLVMISDSPSQNVRQPMRYADDRIIAYSVDTTIRASQNVLHEIGETTKSVSGFIAQRQQKGGKRGIEGIPIVAIQPTIKKDARKIHREGMLFSRYEKPIRMLPFIQKRQKETIRAKKALVAIRETGVGLGAVPVLLLVFTQEMPRQIRAVEKSMRRHEKKELRMKNKERTKKTRVKIEVSVKVQPRKTERGEFLKKRTKEKRTRKVQRRRSGEGGREKVVNKKAIAEKLTLFVREKAKEKNRLVKEEIPKKLRESKRFRKESRAFNRKGKKSPAVASQRESLRSPEKRGTAGLSHSIEGSCDRRTVVRMQFAWMVWWLFHKQKGIGEKDFNKFPTGKTLKRSVLTRVVYDANDTSGRLRRAEILPEIESTAWILISIIWYLTLIRESGLKITNNQYPISQRNNVKKKSVYHYFLFPFQPNAVIFAFGS